MTKTRKRAPNGYITVRHVECGMPAFWADADITNKDARELHVMSLRLFDMTRPNAGHPAICESCGVEVGAASRVSGRRQLTVSTDVRAVDGD